MSGTASSTGGSAPLRVALCTDGIFPFALGGMQRHSRLLAEHLAQHKDVHLTVIHPHTEPVFEPSLGINETRVAAIDPRRFYLAELWRYSGRVAQVLEEQKPDVILSQGFSVWKHAGRLSDRLIVHPHGLEMFQGLTWKDRLLGLPFRVVLRYIVRRSRVVISLGGKLTGILERMVLGSECGVKVIPNAVELPRSVEPTETRTDGPLRLLFVGRFASNKGLDVLLRVADRLIQEGRGDAIHFQLAGDGPLRDSLEAAPLPNVEILGRVDDEHLDALYRSCDALVLPTRFEGMPTVVLEAMARSKPIIVSDVGACAELVDGANGSLLPPGDASALYEAIIDLMNKPTKERSNMGRRSFEKVSSSFSWPKVTGMFMHLFRQLGN